MTLRILENVSIGNKTTMGVGGCAEYYTTIHTEASLFDALSWAHDEGHDVTLLGGGSNVIVADRGIRGIVLHLGMRGIERKSNLFCVAAGEPWDAFVQYTINSGYGGLECLSGIPGYVGGSPIQNIGAYGQEVSQCITKVRVADRITGTSVEMTHNQCEFAYRTSVFKNKSRYIILNVSFSLENEPHYVPLINYQELNHALKSQFQLTDIRNTVLQLRKNKSMIFDENDGNSRGVGSFFTNPILSKEQFDSFQTQFGNRYKNIPFYIETQNRIKIPAGWLIEHASCQKGSKNLLGNVGLSEKHALAIVNYGGARSVDIVEFASNIRKRVFDIFGISLQPEPVFYGFTTDELHPLLGLL